MLLMFICVFVPLLIHYLPLKGSSYTLDNPAHVQTLRACLESLVAKVPQHEDLLNALDSGCGDGDCGTTLLLGIHGESQLGISRRGVGLG